MENSGSILAAILGAAALACFGFWLDKERRERRKILAVIRDESDPLVAAVDQLMLDGQLAVESRGLASR